MDFRLVENPDEVMRFVYEVRRQAFITRRFTIGSRKDPGLYIDLDPIKRIDLEGALVLAAELDRLRRVLRIKAVLDDKNWDPFVRAILHALGLYDVIDARRAFEKVPMDTIEDELERHGLAVLPFISGTEVEGQKVLELQKKLHETCEPTAAQRRQVYDSLVEAFTNAVQHAYEDDVDGDGLPRVRRWWAGALFDRREGYLYLVVYDQGVGIPGTLPRRSYWALLSGRLPETTDAAVIEGALEYGRSRVDTDGRGNGYGACVS
jgi:hypothetical protein